ncbi:MAG TPA: ABC transporter substrate-binding protein [Mycobacteriales bacterium]|nr:ABC transporter substrate-binding protein [Mycobacteriales bacterium]
MNRLIVSAACVGLSIAVLAGCGSSSSDDAGSGAATSSSGNPSSAGSKAPIVVGNVGSYSGPQASSEAGARKVVQAWADSVNAAGGINGHPVKLIIKDAGGSTTGGLVAVKELVEQDHVVAIIGDQDNADQTWASYIQSKGVPVIGGLPINLPFMTNPDFFPIGTNIVASIYGYQMLAKSIGPKFGFLYCAEAPQCASSVPLAQALAKSTGLQIPVIAKVSGSAPDYVAVCQQLKDAGVDSYEVGSGAEVVLRIAKACKQQGVTAKQVTTDGTMTTAWLSEPAMDGALSSQQDFPFVDDSVPATQAYQAAIAKYAPDLGNFNGPNAAYAWVSGKLLEKAIENAGTDEVSAQSVKDGLYMMKDETLGGLTPPLTFVKDKPTLVNCYFTMGVKDGKFTTPNGLKTDCAPDAVINAIASQLS